MRMPFDDFPTFGNYVWGGENPAPAHLQLLHWAGLSMNPFGLFAVHTQSVRTQDPSYARCFATETGALSS